MFEHDAQVALAGAAGLVGQHGCGRTGGERPTPRSASRRRCPAAFLDTWQWTGVPVLTSETLHRVRALRPRLRELWTAELPAKVDGVNELLAEFHARPRLVRHDPSGWHVHATDDDAPLHARMAVEAAMAMFDVIRADETERLRLCSADDCSRVLVDLSRNRSKTYCDASCANRAHAAAYRARRGRA